MLGRAGSEEARLELQVAAYEQRVEHELVGLAEEEVGLAAGRGPVLCVQEASMTQRLVWQSLHRPDERPRSVLQPLHLRPRSLERVVPRS